jgi:asparagine synthase (glutamine-hydrolysing)
MCGILTALRLTAEAPLPDQAAFTAALELQKHRGPDGRNTKFFGDAAQLGQARLSIIDLSQENSQPFTTNGRHWIVFNGEIFNYIELRNELLAAGAAFKTQGDTEVILQAYLKWGPGCVQRFNGMWAFAIYDGESRSLFCSRDRFGEKPFNYAEVDGIFFAASEIKSILRLAPKLADPNLIAIANFCRSSIGAQHEDTWFEGVKRLQPGENLIVANGQIRTERYWTYPKGDPVGIAEPDALAQYQDLLQSAVKLRLRSDVPVGLTLSAGLDSTSIANIVRLSDGAGFNCYTARFNDKPHGGAYSKYYRSTISPTGEHQNVDRLAKEWGLKSHLVDIDHSNISGAVAEAIYSLESGNSSPAAIPSLQVMKRAREDVTVVLEGQGADELLGGYITTTALVAAASDFASGRIRRSLSGLAEFRKVYTLLPALVVTMREQFPDSRLLNNVFRRSTGALQALSPALQNMPYLADTARSDEASGARDMLTASLLRQHSGGLVNLLHYGDAMSMLASVEARNPFLDHRLVEFVWNLPNALKAHGARGKIIHRESLKHALPDYILKQPKIGFATPVSAFFMRDYDAGGEETPLDILLSKRCADRGLFDGSGLSQLIEAHASGSRDHGYLLYRMLCTEIWFRTFIDRPLAS